MSLWGFGSTYLMLKLHKNLLIALLLKREFNYLSRQLEIFLTTQLNYGRNCRVTEKKTKTNKLWITQGLSMSCLQEIKSNES